MANPLAGAAGPSLGIGDRPLPATAGTPAAPGSQTTFIPGIGLTANGSNAPVGGGAPVSTPSSAPAPAPAAPTASGNPQSNFYAQQAAQYAPGSAMYSFWNGFANSGTAPNAYQQSLIDNNLAYQQASPPDPTIYQNGGANAPSGQIAYNAPTVPGATYTQLAPGAAGLLANAGPGTTGAAATPGTQPAAAPPSAVNPQQITGGTQPVQITPNGIATLANGNPTQASPANPAQPNQNALLQNMSWLAPLFSLFGMMQGMGNGGYAGPGNAGPAALWSALFGNGNGTVGGTSPNLSSIMQLFGQPGFYNPYGLPLYTRQQMQWGNGFS